MALLLLPYVALVIPAALVIAGPLKSNGWPPRLLIFWIAAAVVLGWISHSQRKRVSPAEVGCWILGLGLVVAMSAGGLRPLTEEEAAGAIRAALVMFPLVVVALGVAASADRRRCDWLLVGLLVGGSLSALVGLVQAVSPFDLEQVMRLPGLNARESGGMGERGDFMRVKGATEHPIEYGVLAGGLVPLALHFARHGWSHHGRVAGTATAGLLLVAIPMSVSRSGVLTVLFAVAMYSVVLNARQRITALVLGLAGVVLFRAAIPGLLGTLRSMFLGAGDDPSISGRTEDYSIVNRLFLDSPVLGHGLGTFRPEEYFFLDNQYLLYLIEGGLVLVVATLAWILLTMASCRGVVQRTTSSAEASRAQAVLSAIFAITLSGLFFDLFSFAQITVVLFLLVGVAGALWHHAVEEGAQLATPLERVRAR